VKIYRAADGSAKGDASVCYLKEPAVELAVALLDGVDLRPPRLPLAVQPASFERKDGVAPKPRPARKRLTADEQAARIKELEQQVALSWTEEGDETLGLRIVVLRHMFTPAEAAAGGAGFAAELQEDVGAELEAKCGEIEKLTVFARHADGVVVVKFKSAGAAATCLETMNGRFFGGRRIACEYWDGVTDFRPKETEADQARRLEEFGKWLEGGEGGEGEGTGAGSAGAAGGGGGGGGGQAAAGGQA
jgi:HIV Tat-specific factor 1